MLAQQTYILDEHVQDITLETWARWKDTIKIDLKETRCESVDYIRLVPDRDQC
jgi:hypothetical protein